MRRKDFLTSILALSGTALVPSASASVARHIENLSMADVSGDATTILMGDIHISGDFNEQGKPKHYPYNPICFEQQVREILAMRPLPRNLIILGDVAWDHGLREDYEYAARLFRPLQEAGIRITMAMGNHDRRAPFFEVFGEYRTQTKVKGRVVSVVELPDVDFVVLDSLDELPNLKRGQSTTVSGKMDDEQIKWLESYLATAKRPASPAPQNLHQEVPLPTPHDP